MSDYKAAAKVAAQFLHDRFKDRILPTHTESVAPFETLNVTLSAAEVNAPNFWSNLENTLKPALKEMVEVVEQYAPHGYISFFKMKPELGGVASVGHVSCYACPPVDMDAALLIEALIAFSKVE